MGDYEEPEALLEENGFPIMWPSYMERERLYKAKEALKRIPWSLIKPHERQAQSNHGQTLRRLAARGGLSACEAIALIEDRPWHRMVDDVAIPRLKELVAAWPVQKGDTGC